jgi:predicted HTH domain antitoxin
MKKESIVTVENRLVEVSVEHFKQLLRDRLIRIASEYDVEGIHHNRALYQHPNTGAWYVSER